ncbi:MAG: hypothetical protein F9K10_00295 [Paludibacter sp.]|nr:MAG: hypothetical protein F9K10_00295 [Paludibacter sp.]
MKNLLIVAILAGSYQLATAQSWFPLSHPLSAGGTPATDTRHRGLFLNPALHAPVKHPQLYAEYESRYSITELASKGLAFAYPFSHFTVTAEFRYSGFEAYHELLAGVAVARDFGGKFGMGLQLVSDSRYSVETDRYYTAFYPYLGLTVPLSPALLLGISTFNPFLKKMKYAAAERTMPSVYSAGLNVKITESVQWRLQADKEISNALRVGSAFDISVSGSVFFQAGVSYLHFFVPALGAGFLVRRWRFDLTATLHPLLGLSVAGGLGYHF